MLYIYAYLDIVSNRFSISNIPLPITDLTLYIKLLLIKLTSSLALLQLSVKYVGIKLAILRIYSYYSYALRIICYFCLFYDNVDLLLRQGQHIFVYIFIILDYDYYLYVFFINFVHWYNNLLILTSDSYIFVLLLIIVVSYQYILVTYWPTVQKLINDQL